MEGRERRIFFFWVFLSILFRLGTRKKKTYIHTCRESSRQRTWKISGKKFLFFFGWETGRVERNVHSPRHFNVKKGTRFFCRMRKQKEMVFESMKEFLGNGGQQKSADLKNAKDSDIFLKWRNIRNLKSLCTTNWLEYIETGYMSSTNNFFLFFLKSGLFIFNSTPCGFCLFEFHFDMSRHLWSGTSHEVMATLCVCRLEKKSSNY